MKNSTVNPFYSTSSAVLFGSVLVSLSILVHGGIIKIGKQPVPTPAPVAAAAAQPAAAQPPKKATITLDQVKNAFSKSAIKFGDTNKKLVALEVADPSCPFCHVAAGKNPELNKQAGDRFKLVADGGSYVAPVPELEKLVKSGKIAFSYIYYPGHGNGEMGAKALYCANEKGKFWEVHDLLMNSQGYDLLNNKVKNDKTKSQDIADFLASAFDATAMKQCLDSGKYDAQLQSDVSLANGLSISATPGFYLNATEYPGAYNYTDMEATVNQAIGG